RLTCYLLHWMPRHQPACSLFPYTTLFRSLLVAEEDGEVAGVLAFRTDWFQCTFVGLVGVDANLRRRGVARALYGMVEEISPSPRLFSSTEETNAVSIRMHTALGFVPSGYIDNLPQGYREPLFY